MSTPSTQFAYVRGNPDNLVGSGDADMGDIQGPFYDIEDYLNSGILDAITRGGLIIGEVRFIAVPNPPAMWVRCDGQSLERALFPELFGAISTTYGPGAVPGSTFAVPDLRGRVAVGTGAPDGTGANRVNGQKFGVETIPAAALPAHQHVLNDGGGYAPLNNGWTDRLVAAGPGYHVAGPSDNSSFPNNLAQTGTNFAAGGSTHSQPSLGLPAYIYAGA